MDGTEMSRIIVIMVAGLALAGCASGGGSNFGGMNFDWFPKFEPTPVSVQFQSEPAGAEAKTTAGTACKTPCTLAMAPDKDFAVTFSLAGYQPQTVQVALQQEPGEPIPALSPNPVAVELAPAPKTPPKRAPARTASKPAPKPAAARPAAAPRPAASAPGVPSATDPWPPAR